MDALARRDDRPAGSWSAAAAAEQVAALHDGRSADAVGEARRHARARRSSARRQARRRPRGSPGAGACAPGARYLADPVVSCAAARDTSLNRVRRREPDGCGCCGEARLDPLVSRDGTRGPGLQIESWRRREGPVVAARRAGPRHASAQSAGDHPMPPAAPGRSTSARGLADHSEPAARARDWPRPRGAIVRLRGESRAAHGPAPVRGRRRTGLVPFRPAQGAG